MATETQEILLTVLLLAIASVAVAAVVRRQWPDFGLHVGIMIISLTAYFVWIGIMLPASRYFTWGLFFAANFISAAVTILITKSLSDRRRGMERQAKRRREDAIWWLQVVIMLSEFFLFFEVFPHVVGVSGWLLDCHLTLP